MITLAQLLERSALGLALRAGVAIDREVRWVTTSELDDPTPYLEGGELLLTTGLAAHRWPGYVERLVAAGVPGVGFGTGVSHAEIPSGLLTAAATAGLVVLEVPERTPFIAVGKAVADLLAAEERRSTAASLAIQRELTDAIRRPDGRERVLRRLQRATGGRIVVVDRGRDPEGLGEVARRLVAQVAAGRASATETSGGTSVLVQALGSGHQLLVAEDVPPLDAAGRAGLVTAATLLGLQDEARADRARHRHRLADLVLRLLDTGHVRAAAELLDELALPLPTPLRQLRATGVPPDLPLDAPGLVGTTDAGALHALVPATAAEAVAAQFVAHGARVGIGREVGLAEVAADRSAAAAHEQTSAAAPAVSWEDLSPARVDHLLTPAVAAALADDALGRLRAEPELIETLRCHLARHGRSAPVAEELGIHRNTLRQRLARIAALTGRDLDDPDDRAVLWIALRV